MPYDASQHEQDILAFWKENDTFQKSIDQRPEDKPYVFFDGPPFATGLPHYGHIVASVMKDVVPRYQTMKGHRVNRVWGWDCHGLPIENIVEKELGTKSKKDIEDMGVEKFNELCRSKVLGYVSEWEKTIHRLGRWVDMKHAYRTMDKEYMESVWWVFKELWDGGYIYKGYKPMHICPRCETTLSQQEVSEGYKDIKDISVTAQFRVQDTELKKRLVGDGDAYLLAWTTTPWTLPGNVLIAVGEDLEYTIVKLGDAHFIVAKDLVMTNFEGKEFEVMSQVHGKDLAGLYYEPLFPYYADSENSFRVVTADFVTTEDGTGLVHLAPAFGTDDYEVFRKEHVPFIQHVGMDGVFKKEVTDFAGLHVKPVEDHMATDIEIVKWLAHNGKLFAKKKYEHSYPHCWRCDTPLLNYATDSWFVDVTKVKKTALKLAEDINWSPAHMKEGRFGKWLEGARDWSISRQRFWASVIPVWQSEDGDQICIGSVEELETLSGQKVDDLHKHVVDKITFEKDGKTYTRVPDVLDTWFDSGSMPYAQVHYPFEQKESFEQGFPAEFIAEGQDQTRAWFYYLHIIASAIKGKPAFKNVIVNGIVLAEDGKKMSKKLQNYPDPNKILEQYGADALRYYLVTSPVMQAENLSFAESGVREVYNKVVNTLWNVVEFYNMFADQHSTFDIQHSSDHVLDRWILARLGELKRDVTNGMEAYNLPEASRPIMDFVLDLSQWYLRRSRDRFKSDDEAEKNSAVETLGYVLLELSKVMAPFTPFIAEKIYQTVNSDQRLENSESVHLAEWPVVEEDFLFDNIGLLETMNMLRESSSVANGLRKENKISTRQVLSELIFTGDFSCESGMIPSFESLFAEEINVKHVVFKKLQGESTIREIKGMADEKWKVSETNRVVVALNTELTDALKNEGLLREVVRAVNQMRKDQGLTREDRVVLSYKTDDALLQSVFTEFKDELMSSVLADDVVEGSGEKVELSG
ncbi:MAG: Isoleucine-tRNA ligase, partial [Candidatus Magasanikbacteria bacterium GW2011_GWD2_43_18]